MEGKIPIDPSAIEITNEKGEDLFKYIPRPDFVTESILDDDNLMMFCASAITVEIMDKKPDGTMTLKNGFISAVENFGDHVLLLSTGELLTSIRNTKDSKGQKMAYESGLILFRDLNDFENTEEYRITKSMNDRYFVKGNDYRFQHEWRVIIDGEEESLSPNCGSGFILKASPLKYSMLFSAKDFFDCEFRLNP